MNADRRFLTDSGPEIFTGNELLVKGALETDGGVHLLGGYPGSPVAGYFDSMAVLKELLEAKGIRAVINNNEALAAAMLNGTQTLPIRAMIVLKSVGVHVAADALALANLAGAHREGGAIVVYGDDPWSDSTQVPADSRYISKHLYIPVIEPSNAQEVKDFVDLSFKLSRRSELIAGYIITTNLSDGGGTVECRPNQYPSLNMRKKLDLVTSKIDLNKRVLLPPKTWWQEESLPKRHGLAIEAAREMGMNTIHHSPGHMAELGFVSAGLGHDYLIQALSELGVLGEFPVLKYGMSYPLDEGLLEELARQCRRIVVVEERRGFLEEQIAEAIQRRRSDGGPLAEVELYGKRFPHGLDGIPATRGLHPSILVSLLGPLIDRVTPPDRPAVHETIQRELADMESTERVPVDSLPIRLATFCPGCPHRDSAGVCLEIKRKFRDPRYMQRVHHRDPVDLLFHGDTGCYTMLMYPPNTDLMHDYSGMGLGGGTGSGTDPFVTNKEVVFMGDGTFFHSGLTGISQAIYLNQDITFIILDNSTTAMTGHQPNPGVDYDILGSNTSQQDIEEVVRGMAGGKDILVTRADPEKRLEYRELLEKTFLSEGVKVIIATKECGITRTRRRKREERATTRQQGFLPTKEHMNINQEICRYCLACSEMTGCPGLRQVETDYGRKMDTDISWCVADGSCERVGACDAFERVTIKRRRQPRSKVPELGLDDIPEPRKREIDSIWRGCLTGVGGMGIGVATSILVRAGHKEGYRVRFLDKKGLAIRNGGVVSQVIYVNDDAVDTTALISFGKADLLLGVDILEAARTLDPTGRFRVASKERTAAVINTDKVNTIAGLMGREDFDVEELEELIRRYTKADDFLARNISRICEKYLGSKLYANIMMMGFAFQKGLIPVSMHSMAWAIKDAIRVDFRKNLYAFNMGRKLVEQPELFQGPPVRVGWKDTLEEKCRYTQRRYGKASPLADRLRELVATSMERLADLDETVKRDIVVRAYDCLRWGGTDYAREYLELIESVYAKDRPEYQYAATLAAVQNLASAMLIKDSIFQAELATSKEKYRRDQEKYNINLAHGDRVRYRHLWKRKISIGPWQKRIDIPLSDWHLKTLKRMRWLRWVFRPWTKQAREHRDRYQQKVRAFAYGSADEYRRQVSALSSRMCFGCLSPSCSQAGCPLGSDIPEWMEHLSDGKWREAADRIQEKNNFPEFTGEICPAFCEEACKQALHKYPVQVRATEREVIEKAFEEGWVQPRPAEKKTHKRVAVIGSGPAGLAAAQQLARAGHEVTVFEKDPRPGGLLRYGIPEFRLAKELIDRRIRQLEGEGIQFCCGVAVGRDVSAETLKKDYDAVCLALGAKRPRDLNVPGREHPGVVFAMDYLKDSATTDSEQGKKPKKIDARGKRVAVLGGGLTGEDCVEAAVLQGATEVHQVEILPRSRAAAAALLDTPPEKVEQHYAVATKQFVGQDNGNGRLKEISAVRVKYVPSAKGPKMEEVPGSEFHIPADMAILALGFEPKVDEDLVRQLGLVCDDNGKVDVSENYNTTTEGVFAAGDLVTGASYVATAIDSGRRAADRIHRYLMRDES